MAIKNKIDEYILVRHANRHVRKQPNSTAESIHVTRVGEKYAYLGKVQNGWYKVKVGGRMGWVYHSAGDIHDGFKEILKLKTGNWHVREEARPKAKSLLVVNETSEVVSLGTEENNWHMVEVGDVQGWISVKAIVK